MSAARALPETVSTCVRRLQETAKAVGEDAWANRFSDLQKRPASGRLSLAVIGSSSGASPRSSTPSWGRAYFPPRLVPLTSVVTTLEYGPEPHCVVHFKGGREVRESLQALWDYAAETSNPKDEKGVREIVVQHPGALLTRGVKIIDTPGIGSVYEHNTDVTLGFLPHVDAALRFTRSCRMP